MRLPTCCSGLRGRPAAGAAFSHAASSAAAVGCVGCSPAATCTASSLLRALLRALLLRPPVPPILLLLAMMVCSVARAASSCPLMTSHRGDSGRETRDANRNAPGGQQAMQGAPGITNFCHTWHGQFRVHSSQLYRQAQARPNGSQSLGHANAASLLAVGSKETQGKCTLLAHRPLLAHTPGIAGSPTIHLHAPGPASEVRARLTNTADSMPSVNITWGERGSGQEAAAGGQAMREEVSRRQRQGDMQ